MPAAAPAVKDWYGDEHEVEAQIRTDTGERLVYFDEHRFTPDAARTIARQLLAAADALDGLILIDGGAPDGPDGAA